MVYGSFLGLHFCLLMSSSFKLLGKSDSSRNSGTNSSFRDKGSASFSASPVSQPGLYQMPNFSIWPNTKHLEMAFSQRGAQS